MSVPGVARGSPGWLDLRPAKNGCCAPLVLPTGPGCPEAAGRLETVRTWAWGSLSMGVVVFLSNQPGSTLGLFLLGEG